jgi:type I restriction enzyme S subunit
MVILRKKVDNDVVHEYCDIFFKSDIFIQQVQIMGFGSVQPQLTVGIINNFNLPIPKQPEEQRQIADCLTSLDSLIDLKQQELDKLGIYKKGLLQQLLVQG